MYIYMYVYIYIYATLLPILQLQEDPPKELPPMEPQLHPEQDSWGQGQDRETMALGEKDL